MYAQRFGSLPIGHQTGGLAETITDGETGFLFKPSTESFLGGVRRAFSASAQDPRHHASQRDGTLVPGASRRQLQRAVPEGAVAIGARS